jgi:hypothetical protein
MLFIPQVNVSMDSHGGGGDDDDDDAGWGKLLTRPLELSGNPTSRDIWKRVGGMYEGENFACQYLRYVNGFLTCRKILRHGVPSEGRCAENFYGPYKAIASAGFEPATLGPVASTLTTTPLMRLFNGGTNYSKLS